MDRKSSSNGGKRAPDPAVRLTVHVQPKAAENRVVGFDAAGRLRVRVTAAPADGKANVAVVELIAGALGVARHRVTVERGQASRTKIVRVSGMTPNELDRAIQHG